MNHEHAPRDIGHSAEEICEARAEVNAAKITALRSTFESFRKGTRARLRQIHYTLIGTFSTLVITLISLVVTFLSSA